MLGLKSLVLSLCAVLFSGGCNPKQDPTGPRPAETLTTTEIAGIRLTYMCGNTFRVRNPNDQEAIVTWDVYQKNESGSLTLPPKPAGALHSETFFTTVNKGTVRLFYDGQLIQTKANGNKPACQVAADTSRPVMPTTTNWPLENPLLVTVPDNPTYRNFRDVFGIQFDDSTSGTTIRAFLAHFNATIIGGFGHGTSAPFYVIRVPDPGTTVQAVDSLQGVMKAHPGVKRTMAMNYEGSWRQKGRYPIDAAVAPTRASWFGGGTPDNYPWLAVRAPLAWGCETGAYGGSKVKVGVLDAYFDIVHRDLSSSATATFRPAQSEMVLDAGFATRTGGHGTAVLGIIAAEGDNGQDMAGMVWNADLSLYAFGQGQYRSTDPVAYLGSAMSSAASRGVQVLNLSFGLGEIRQPDVVAALKDYLRDYLGSAEDRLLVLAVGDNSVTVSLTDLQASTDSRLTALDKAAAQLYSDPAYRGKIIFVTGTVASGMKRPVSNSWTGADQIAAPAEAVLTLDGSSSTVTWDGTSFAAPFVAGSAAQLWAMDPSLTAAQVKDYILRGAQEKRVDSTTGVALVPADIGVAGVYQLDAYGALSLLSRERQGTPICGFPVSLAVAGDAVLLQRSQNSVETVPVPPTATAVSVAQGGRLMAVSLVDTGDPLPHEFKLQNGVWSDVRTLSQAYERRYLERDTVDLRWDEATNHTISTIRRADGSVTQIDLHQTVEPTQLYGFALREPFFSPSGDFVLVGGHYTFQEGCPTWLDGKRWHLLHLPNGPATLLEDNVMNTCDFAPGEILTDEEGTASWSLDGTRFALGIIQMMLRQPERDQYTAYQSRLIEGVVSGTSATIRDVTTSGRSVHPYAYSPGNEFISAQENLLVDPTTFDCKRTTRLVQSLATVLTESPVPCFSPVPVLMNSVASLQLGRLGSRLGKSLESSRGPNTARPAAPRRVQAN